MPSKARVAFSESCEEIDRLLEIHADYGGNSAGRRRRLEVLNKAAIVLLAALWEAYCEDLAAEALQHLVTNAATAEALPDDLKRHVAKELERELHELATWKLADDGWRAVLTSRLEDLREDRARRLNTPKTAQIDELFSKATGISKVSSSWSWPGMSTDRAAEKLDRYVELRGSIAHRGAATESVHRADVTDFYSHVKRLVSKTGGTVNYACFRATGTRLWPQRRRNRGS